jgi:hypothetical protein
MAGYNLILRIFIAQRLSVFVQTVTPDWTKEKKPLCDLCELERSGW